MHISRFYIASFMPHHVHINQVRREHALQQQYVVYILTASGDKDRAQAFVLLRLIIPPKMLHLLANCDTVSPTDKQKRQTNHLY